MAGAEGLWENGFIEGWFWSAAHENAMSFLNASLRSIF